MKVIFLEDVPNVGKAGQIKEVAEGYGRNYLIPHKLAAPARPDDIRNVEAQIKARARLEAKTLAEMEALAKELKDKEITLTARVGQQGRLYGSITTANISVALEKQLGIKVDKRKIDLTSPIHQIGTHPVSIHLGKDINTKIKVTINPENPG